jgi:GAF domain-containing protein
VESIERDQPIGIQHVAEQRHRWPDYCDGVEPIGFHAVLGLPLRLDDHRVGSLDVYSASPREWGEDALEAGLVLADIGAAYVLSASELAESQRTTQQLQTALDTRLIIEQAKGILSERLGVTPTEAFERLRAAARRRSVKLSSLARRVIDEGDFVPD